MNSEKNLNGSGKKKKGRLFSFRYLFMDFVRVTSFIPLWIFFRPKKIYENETARKKIKGGAIIICNHFGFIDPGRVMNAFWYRRIFFMAAQELYSTKLKSWFFTKMGCFPVNRENFNVRSFNTVRELAADNRVVCIFPSGHICFGDAIDKFKPGAVLMAAACGVPIIPVYISERKNVLYPTKVVVGEPIDVKKSYGQKPTLADMDRLTEDLYNKIISFKETVVESDEKSNKR